LAVGKSGGLAPKDGFFRRAGCGLSSLSSTIGKRVLAIWGANGGRWNVGSPTRPCRASTSRTPFVAAANRGGRAQQHAQRTHDPGEDGGYAWLLPAAQEISALVAKALWRWRIGNL
jgi:hypothetical protein